MAGAWRTGWRNSTVQEYHRLEIIKDRLNPHGPIWIQINPQEFCNPAINLVRLPSTAKALWRRSFAALTTALTTERALLQFLSSSLALLRSWDWRSPSYSLLQPQEKKHKSEKKKNFILDWMLQNAVSVFTCSIEFEGSVLWSGWSHYYSSCRCWRWRTHHQSTGLWSSLHRHWLSDCRSFAIAQHIWPPPATEYIHQWEYTHFNQHSAQ